MQRNIMTRYSVNFTFMVRFEKLAVRSEEQGVRSEELGVRS